MKHRKTMKALTAVLALCLCVCGTAGVHAYLSDEAASKNTFTVGYNEPALEEPDFVPPPSMTPGGEYGKTVQVENPGGGACYVRAKLIFSDGGFEDLVTLDLNTSDWQYSAGNGWYYYKKALGNGETTVPLMTTVTVKAGVTQEELDALGSCEISACFESVQQGSAETYSQAWSLAEENR